MSSDDYSTQADELLSQSVDAPMSLDEYVEQVLSNPQFAAHAGQYLLDAIETSGKRTVIEEGEEKERWRFFDDPYNDGEHAVLGNTDILNQFVRDLRQMASDYGKENRIVWFDGPTATGKSELKRCLINGLKGYSKTDDGRRFTCEWNINTRSASGGLAYGDDPVESEDDWYQSPVQANPLAVYPEEVQTALYEDLNASTDIDLSPPGSLDPFSREAFDFLKRHYQREETDNIFTAITNPSHFRIIRYTMDVGQGIGVLHSEDSGQPKERLVGSWMRGMLQKLDSRGRKNPQAFSYDGLLSQGHNGVSIVEDASQHADLLQKLLNVPEEEHVKLDKEIGMDIDTVMIIISNPDLDAQLNQHEEKVMEDPLKALKRRLDKYSFRYLTSLSSEVELLHREILNEREVWTDSYEDRVTEPVSIRGTELAPHALEAAAMYSVATRLHEVNLPDGLDFIDTTLLFERGYIEDDDGNKQEKDDFEFDEARPNGTAGIPVTYTQDIISDLLQSDDEVVLPQNILSEMQEKLDDAPVFSDGEVTEFQNRMAEVDSYIFGQQEEDVIAAILRNHRVDEEEVSEYIEHVYAWATGEGDVDDPDPLKMKVFETQFLNRDDGDYDGTDPSEEIEGFRQDRVMTSINSYIWDQRDDDFNVDEFPLKDVPVLASVLGEYDWSDVQELYENLDPSQWADPPENTETEAVKEQCIENMQEMFDYSEESAEQTSNLVMDQVKHTWD